VDLGGGSLHVGNGLESLAPGCERALFDPAQMPSRCKRFLLSMDAPLVERHLPRVKRGKLEAAFRECLGEPREHGLPSPVVKSVQEQDAIVMVLKVADGTCCLGSLGPHTPRVRKRSSIVLCLGCAFASAKLLCM
jgi:hypothetical protein